MAGYRLNVPGALLAWLLMAALPACRDDSAAPSLEPVTINGRTFNLELAITPQARETGLKHRTSIADDGGMLFVFPDSDIKVQRFWMHECLTDMDLMFLDARGAITALHRMKTEPLRRPDETEEAYQLRLKPYTSAYPAQFAIELAPGTLDELGVKVEQKITLDLKRLKALAR